MSSKIVSMMILMLIAFNTMSVLAMNAEQGPPITVAQGRTAYAEILNHSIQVAEELLRRWEVPPASEPRYLLSRAVELARRVSEAGDGELARKYFLEGMNYVYSAISLAVNTSLSNKQSAILIEIRKGLQEIQILNETLNSIKLRLLYLNRSVSTQSATINAYLLVITELASRLTSLKGYLTNVESRPENFNKTYVLGELAAIKGQVRTLDRELNNLQLSEVRRRLEVRVSERLRNFNDEIGKLSRAVEDVKRWGVPEVNEVIGARVEEIASAINTSKQLLSMSENLGNLEYLRTVSNIDSVFNSLNLSLKNLNNMLDELRRLRDLIDREASQIEEVSARLGQVLRNGRLPPNVHEQLAEVIKVGNQVVNESTNLLRNLVVNTTSANASLYRFESMVKKGMTRSQELRKSLTPHHQYSEIVSLISNVENSLNNMLENVNTLSKAVSQINDGEKVYTEKLITTSIKALDDLSLCRTDPTTKELLNTTSTLLRSALISVKADDLETARNSLNSALDRLKEIKSRLPYPHTLRVDIIIRYLRLTLSRLHFLGS